MKVLLVRFSAIGDCAMATYTASCIRRSYPEATLVWAVEERCAPVVDDTHLVSSKAIVPRERWRQGAWSPNIWREQARFYSQLRRFRFDFGLDLQGHSKTAICLRLSGAKQRLATRATDPLARRLNPLLKDFGGAKHTVERQLHALRTFGSFPGDSTPIMSPLVDGPQLLLPYVAIAVGAGQPWKAYPLDLWKQVAGKLAQTGRRVVLIGGPGESGFSFEGVTNLVGKLDLSETKALIARSSLVLAADTGAGHLAAAFGVPVVSIFGPTDPDEFRPYTSRGVVLREGKTMNAVSPEMVVETVSSLLGSATPSSTEPSDS